MSAPHDPLGLAADATTRRAFARKLSRWFQRHRRDLPWRHTTDLYRIWISEIMLQQTQVATVIPYYERFLAAFPDVRTLADADEQNVLGLWEGLGYYRGARQLHAAARKIRDEHAGAFPETFDDVLALPGIGRYTAGAILSIGRDQPLPILEANTIRLFTRLLNETRNPTLSGTQKTLWEFATALLPSRNVGDFNQALMELGSLICTPKQPACNACPAREHCRAHRTGDPLTLPRREKSMQYEEVREVAVIVRKQNRVLVRQCRDGERWSGLWDFPRFALTSGFPEELKGSRGGNGKSRNAASRQTEQATPAQTAAAERSVRKEVAEKLVALTGIQAEVGAPLTTLRHGVTRFRITLHCFEAEYVGGRRRRDHTLDWMSVEAIKSLPLSVTGRKLVEIL